MWRKLFCNLVDHKSDRDLFRYLWLEHLFDPEIPEIQGYLFARLTFGAIAEAKPGAPKISKMERLQQYLLVVNLCYMFSILIKCNS